MALVTLALTIYTISRVPLLPLGFGSDHDAWSVANGARLLLETGTYRPSRMPGHPVHELLVTLLLPCGGYWVLNVANLAVSMALLFVVYRIGDLLRVEQPMAAVAALSVHPLLWIASADSTDFVLATTLAYGSLLAFIYGRPRLSGGLLGLACGARIEVAVFIGALMLIGPPNRSAELRRACATAIGVAGLVFTPTWLSYLRNPGSLGHIVASSLSPSDRILTLALGVWTSIGLVALIVVASALAAHARRVSRLAAEGDRVLRITAFLGLAYLCITLIHPSKAAYLLPVVPLLLLTITRVAGPRWTVAVGAAFLTYAFVYPDVIDRHAGSVRIGLRANNGLVVKDWISRWNAVYAADEIAANARRGEVVLLGFWLSAWRWRHPEAQSISRIGVGVEVRPADNEAFLTSEGSIFAHKLNCRSIEQLRGQDIAVRYAEGVAALIRQTYRCEPGPAEVVCVRQLGPEIAEDFTLPCLVECGARSSEPAAFTACVRACASSADNDDGQAGKGTRCAD